MNELKVGFLTLLAIGSLLVVSLRITADRSGMGEHVLYRTILEDASGIRESSSIKVAGIIAGRIKAIKLQGSKALIEFEIKEEIKLTEGAYLRIKSVGFLGDKYIDVQLGNTDLPRLAEGTIIGNKTGGSIEQLSQDAGEVLSDVKDISQSIKEALKDEDGNNIVTLIMRNVRDFTVDAKEVAESLKNITTGNEERINNIIARIEDVSEQLAYETNRNADGSFMSDLKTVKPILDNVNIAVDDLKEIIADVKAGKGTVGRLLRDDEVIDQVNETLSGVNRLVGRVNNFKTDLSLYSGVNSEFGGRTDINIDLIPSPERIFRLGVVISDFGPVSTQSKTTTTSVDGGDEVTTEQRVVNDSQFKLNLQMGRKFNNWMFRAGLIESSGGLGIDYSFFNEGLRTSLEVFDYQENVGPQVRLASELRMYNIFYARVAGEDLVNAQEFQSYTISAGLRFNDDDLAALLGILAR